MSTAGFKPLWCGILHCTANQRCGLKRFISGMTCSTTVSDFNLTSWLIHLRKCRYAPMWLDIMSEGGSLATYVNFFFFLQF